MDEEKLKEIALFRFGVIHDFVSGNLSGKTKRALLEAKIRQKWNIPYSSKTSISKSTLWRWIRRYEGSGRRIESLFPAPRKDAGNQRAIDAETGAALLQLVKEHPHFTVVRLIEEMRRRNLISSGRHLAKTSAYRFLHLHGAMKKTHDKIDRRRFEAQYPNEIWQSDVMHGPHVMVEGKRRKSYPIAFIDDHSRLILHAEFHLSENTDTFMRTFKNALDSRGVPKKLYVDNGSAFRSKHLEWVCASLGISLVHAKPYTPQGKGKIERFFRTVRSEVLPSGDTTTLFDLNNRLDLWLIDIYHVRRHSSTGETPFDRFSKHMERIRSAPGDLHLHFRKKARRRVTNDRIVQLEGMFFEVPAQLIREQVELPYLPENPGKVELVFQGKSYGFPKQLDSMVNARVGREKANSKEEAPSQIRSSVAESESPQKPETGKLSFS